MIVIFLGQIAAGSSVFNLCAFLLACLVVMLVRIYGLAGKVAGTQMITQSTSCLTQVNQSTGNKHQQTI